MNTLLILSTAEKYRSDGEVTGNDVQGGGLYSDNLWGNSCVVIDEMMKLLEGFYHQVDRKIAGISYRQVGESIW